MSKNKLAGIIGLVLVGAYSVLMIATAGAAAPYSWLILAAGIALTATNVRRVLTEKDDGREG